MERNPNQTTTVENEKFVAPPVNICETEEEIILDAEMPGVDKSRLDVSVNGDELVITGRRSKEEGGGSLVWQEIPASSYRRVFSLGDHINRNRIQAAFNNGILTLKLGKAEDLKPRKIEVEYK